MTIEYREILGGETRAVGDESTREIEAKVCSYGVGPDTYNTTWQPGVFTEGLRAALPAVCWSHQSDNIIGSVVDYRDQSDGLYVRMRLADFDAVPEARKAYSLIKDGHVRGWSFGFADGETENDREYKGAVAFRRATMYEVSPVLRASVPLTRTVSVRSADREVKAHNENELAAAITAGVRAALDANQATTIAIRDDGSVSIGERTDHGEEPEMPEQKERIVVEVPDGARSVTLTINDDGTVDTSGTDSGADTASSDDADAAELAQAVDAALDAFAATLDGVDTSALPAPVQQALALAEAAGVAVDELLDAMGVPDPDEDGDRAAKAGDEVTVGKKTGKVKKVMPNGALLIDWGDGKSSLVSAADAEETTERAAKAYVPEHLGFKKLKDMLAAKGAADPGGLAAWIGRKKYGAAGMAAKSAAGRVKAKARSASVDLTDEQAEAEMRRLGLTLESPEIVEAFNTDAAAVETETGDEDGTDVTGDDGDGEPGGDRADTDLIAETRATLDLLAVR